MLISLTPVVPAIWIFCRVKVLQQVWMFSSWGSVLGDFRLVQEVISQYAFGLRGQ